MRDPQKLTFRDIDNEATLIKRVAAVTTRDFYAGITSWNDRKAAIRIAIVVNKLKGQFAEDFERVYGEPLVLEKQLTESNT